MSEAREYLDSKFDSINKTLTKQYTLISDVKTEVMVLAEHVKATNGHVGRHEKDIKTLEEDVKKNTIKIIKLATTISVAVGLVGFIANHFF